MGCIYKITNTVNGQAYIGQTYRDVEVRVLREHLRNTSSSCKSLASAVKECGEDNFTYEILEDGILPELLDSFEIEAIRIHKTLSPHGYNLTSGGGGGSRSLETREKMSEARKGIKFSEEHRLNISKALKGKRLPAETRRKLSEAGKGRKHSKETRQKISEAKKGQPGKPRSLETRRKISEARKGQPGKPCSPEARQKISEGLKGNKNSRGKIRSPEARQRISESKKGTSAWNKGKPHSPETRQKISEARKGQPGKPRSPETCRKISNARKDPMYEPSKQFYFSLPSDINLTEKRKRVTKFSGKHPKTVLKWTRQWESET